MKFGVRHLISTICLATAGVGVSLAVAGGASPARAASAPVQKAGDAGGLPARFRAAFCGDGEHELPVGYSDAVLSEVKRREAGQGPMRTRAAMIQMRADYCGDPGAGRQS